MGTWTTGFFGNDNALDLVERLSRLRTPSDWEQALLECFDALDSFFEREAAGVAYRRMTREEEAACDRALEAGLKDFPELLAQARIGPGEQHRTGGYRRQ